MEVVQKKELSQHELNIIAENIEALGKVGAILNASRLKPKLIYLLLNKMTGVGQRDIELILNAIPQIEREFLKPKPTTK